MSIQQINTLTKQEINMLFLSFLNSDPERAMVVLLPGNVDCDDVTIRLQTTLVEAFCWEYDIRLLKIDNAKDISKMLSQQNKGADAKKLKGVKNTDFNCLLIEVRIVYKILFLRKVHKLHYSE